MPVYRNDPWSKPKPTTQSEFDALDAYLKRSLEKKLFSCFHGDRKGMISKSFPIKCFSCQTEAIHTWKVGDPLGKRVVCKCGAKFHLNLEMTKENGKTRHRIVMSNKESPVEIKKRKLYEEIDRQAKRRVKL